MTVGQNLNFFILDTDYVNYSTSYYCEVLRDPQGVYYITEYAYVLSREPTMTESVLVISYWLNRRPIQFSIDFDSNL